MTILVVVHLYRVFFFYEGELFGYQETPVDTITNCTFGDDHRRTLYVTCGKYLVSMPTQIPGKSTRPPKSEE